MLNPFEVKRLFTEALTLEHHYYPLLITALGHFNYPAGRIPLTKQRLTINIVNVQLSAISHQLNDQIQKDLVGDKVDPFKSESLNFLFLLKADCR
jgi:hypothetical protein